MNKKTKIFLLLAPLFMTNMAHAVIFKCTDNNGNTTYSNVLKKVGPNCIATGYDIAITSPLKGIKSSGGKLQIVNSQQKSRDIKRIEILSKELEAEEKELAWSKDQQKNISVDASTDSLKKNAMLVELHQNNIEALKRQIDIISSSLSKSEPKVSTPKVELPKFIADPVVAPKVEAPKIVAKPVIAPKVEAPKIVAKPVIAPKVEVPKVVDKPVVAPKVEAPKVVEDKKESSPQDVVNKFFGN